MRVSVMLKLLQKTCSHTSLLISLKPLSSKAMSGRPLKDILETLESLAPLRYAESWDNVGLLIEPTAPHVVTKLMLTNDLTQPVLTEAIEKKCNMILSYHPPIFRALKRLRQTDVKEKIVVKCVENRIALFSPHTSYDAAVDGVNDWLLAAFGKTSQARRVLYVASK